MTPLSQIPSLGLGPLGVGGRRGIRYILYDRFDTDRAAGSVNGTLAEPKGGSRTVVDTNSKLSITGGQASFAAGGVGNGNPGLWYSSISRTSGKVLIGKINSNSGNNNSVSFGYSTSQSGFGYELIRFAGGGRLILYGSWGSLIAGNFSDGVLYDLALVSRANGAYYYVKGGSHANWTLLWVSNSGNVETLYPQIIGGPLSVATSDDIRIPTALWLPPPLAYDTFTRADGAAGNTETSGPDGQVTPSLAWSGGSITGGKMVITPNLGSELVVNGNFSAWTADNPNGWTIIGENAGAEVSEVGAGEGWGGTGTGFANMYYAFGSVAYARQTILTLAQWYLATLDINFRANGTLLTREQGGANTVKHATVGSKLYTARSNITGFLDVAPEGVTNITFDNISLKPLTLSSLFCTVSINTPDVLADADVTVVTGTQAGLVINLDSMSSPANFVLAYRDGANVKLEKCVAGVYTALISAAATYVAGAVLRVIKDGTKYRVYYNNALVGAEQTISDAGIISNTTHGLFSTYEGNTFDNFALFARGAGGEYAELDKY